MENVSEMARKSKWGRDTAMLVPQMPLASSYNPARTLIHGLTFGLLLTGLGHLCLMRDPAFGLPLTISAAPAIVPLLFRSEASPPGAHLVILFAPAFWGLLGAMLSIANTPHGRILFWLGVLSHYIGALICIGLFLTPAHQAARAHMSQTFSQHPELPSFWLLIYSTGQYLLWRAYIQITRPHTGFRY